MGARFRSWWQKIKRYRVTILVVAIVLVVVIALIIIGYWFDWTGFNGYNQVTITRTISGTNAGTVTRTEVYQPGKALWDWLQLLGVLAIPVVVGFGAVWFTTRQGKIADAENIDNQRETALQAYIDKMSELLLHENLRNSQPEAEERTIARVRTITILFQLDARRIGYVFAFLRETGLMSNKPNESIVILKDADLKQINLCQANLTEANLSGANLAGANLTEADLSGANLAGANFAGANLSGAVLLGADLSRANLSEANLSKINLCQAILHEANLSKADLSGAILVEADLSEAILWGANLWHANLRRAILVGADLLKADLSGANLSQTNLSEAKSLKGAIMPDGSIHP